MDEHFNIIYAKERSKIMYRHSSFPMSMERACKILKFDSPGRDAQIVEHDEAMKYPMYKGIR